MGEKARENELLSRENGWALRRGTAGTGGAVQGVQRVGVGLGLSWDGIGLALGLGSGMRLVLINVVDKSEKSRVRIG